MVSHALECPKLIEQETRNAHPDPRVRILIEVDGSFLHSVAGPLRKEGNDDLAWFGIGLSVPPHVNLPHVPDLRLSELQFRLQIFLKVFRPLNWPDAEQSAAEVELLLVPSVQGGISDRGPSAGGAVIDLFRESRNFLVEVFFPELDLANLPGVLVDLGLESDDSRVETIHHPPLHCQ